VDLMLKFHHSAPLVTVTNDNAPDGHSNATRVILESVAQKEGVLSSKLPLDGLECPAADATDVNPFLCKPETASDADPVKTFHIKPRSLLCAVTPPLLQPLEETCNV